VQSRRLDELAISRLGFPGILLMENAGRGVADLVCRQGLAGPVVVCCGKGNNGGDGFVAARHLALRGYSVRTLHFAPPESLAGDASVNLAIALQCGLRPQSCDGYNWEPALEDALRGAGCIVDALLGTGARGEPAAPLDSIIDRLNAQGIPIVAVDLPSGLDCDTGAAAAHTIRAVYTCTLAASKVGFSAPGARHWTGEVHVTDIGVPVDVLAADLDSPG
jgi:NAD(P)H-hydrate epimerase